MRQGSSDVRHEAIQPPTARPCEAPSGQRLHAGTHLLSRSRRRLSPANAHVAKTMAHAGPRDPWMGDFNAAKLLGDDCFLLLQERNSLLQKTPNDAGVARLSAASRRKLNALGSMIDRLEGSIGEGGVCVHPQCPRATPCRCHQAPAAQCMWCMRPGFLTSPRLPAGLTRSATGDATWWPASAHTLSRLPN